MPDGSVIGSTINERFFRRLSDDVTAGLTAEQRSAIAAALAAESVNSPPINIRVSIPSPFGRWYVTIFAGREKRSRARLKDDRNIYPLRTFGNILFIAAGVAIFYVLSAVVFLLYSSVLEL